VAGCCFVWSRANFLSCLAMLSSPHTLSFVQRELVDQGPVRFGEGRADVPSSAASKNMKDTSDWSNPTNQRLLNIVLLMITSSDYKTLSSSLRKPTTWIVSSEKPSKLRCIQITSTEVGDSTSANPGSHYCINSRKRDSHPV